jgi:hypothetical protein
MKLSLKKGTLIAGAIAAALGTGAAFAVPPTTTPSFVFYIGGGSAEPQAIGVTTCNLMSNVDLYTDTAGGGAPGKYYMLYGTTKAATPNGLVPAGSNVLVIYKFNGGSLTNGGVPQSSASTGLPYPTVASILASGDTPINTGAGSFCTAGNGVPTYQTPALAIESTNRQPSFGLTDLEASAFVGFNNPLSPAALPVVGAHTPIYDLVFGIAVTSQLFAQKTNFSYSEVAAILGGTVFDWSQLKGDNGAPLTAGPIILLDRNVGSGHKTSSTAEFLGFPQLGSASTTPTSVANGYLGGSDGAGTPPVACNTSGYQDIQETAASGTVSDLKLLAAGGCGLRAIAILSMDNPPGLHANQNVAGTNAYDFVSLNGTWVDANTSGDNENGAVGTGYDNVLKGNYTWYYQANFNTQASFLGTATTVPAADLATAYKNALSSKTLPGCTGSPGAAFPGNMSGVVVDGDQVSTLSACVTNSSRKGSSDRPLIVTLDGGSITVGSEPL